MFRRIGFVSIAFFFLSLSCLAGAEETVEERTLPTELPIVVVKGTDRSYLEVMRPRSFSSMSIRGEKSMADYFFQLALAEKEYSYYPSVSGLERRAADVILYVDGLEEGRKEISPIVLLEPRLSRLPGSYSPARYTTTKVETLSLMPIRAEKPLTEAFVQLAESDREYSPRSKEESSLPYLYITASMAAYDNFRYLLDYGRKKGKMIHLLSLGRDSTPLWTIYEGDGLDLGKSEDWLDTMFIWDFGENKNARLSISGYQKKMDFPEERERKKDKIGVAGEISFKLRGKNILKVGGWVQSMGVAEEGVRDQNINPGAQLELEIPRIPLNIGVSAQNSSYSDKSQFHFWIKNEDISLKFIKGLSAGLEVGVKQVEGASSEVLPRLRLTEQFNPKLRFQLDIEREFYLPEFDDLYLSQDYVDMSEQLDGLIKLWNYEAQLRYELSSLAGLSVGGFYNRGENIVWNWDSVNSLAKPEIRNMSSWGTKLGLLLHLGETFEQGISYTYQKAENIDDPGKVIPNYPQNVVDIWLAWGTAGWNIIVESEFVDERYYEEDMNAEMPSGWKQRFKISREIGENLELFIELLLNNDYYLWKDYKYSKEKLYFGLRGKLY